jgi:hypothetical protein
MFSGHLALVFEGSLVPRLINSRKQMLEGNPPNQAAVSQSLHFKIIGGSAGNNLPYSKQNDMASKKTISDVIQDKFAYVLPKILL